MVSPTEGWIVAGGMTTDFKAVDTIVYLEYIGFVEMNKQESESKKIPVPWLD